MTDRAKALREVIAEELRNDARDPLPTAEQFAGVLARAICEKLGITEELIEACENEGCSEVGRCVGGKCGPCRAADALATLLEAGRTDD